MGLSPTAIPREVYEEADFTAELHGIGGDAEITDRFMFAVVWAIARDPNLAEATRVADNPPLWFIPIRTVEHLSSLILSYTYTEKAVYLLGIEKGATEVIEDET